MIKSLLTALAVAVLSALTPAIALAQAGPAVLDGGRADREPATAPAQAAPPAPAHVEGPKDGVTPFVLTSVVVDGSAVPAARLAPAWVPFVGKTVGADALKTLGEAISSAYGRSDIALYTIVTPRQTFAGGVVRLQVIEGYVEDVRVSGPAAGRLVRAYAAKLKRGLPLRRSRLERYLSLMRDIPGVKLDIQLLRGSKPGAVILDIKATRKRLDGAVSVNTRGTAYLGQNQVRADVYLNGVERQGDQTRLTVAVPTDVDRFQYYGVGQTIALGSEGTNLSLSGGYIRTRPSFTPIQGDAETWGASISQPLIRGYQRNLYATVGLDGVDSSNAAYGAILYTERVRTLRAALALSEQKPNSAASLSGTISTGLPALGAVSGIQGWTDRQFVKVNLAAKWSRSISPQWVVRADTAVQLAANKLPGSEQFSLGGEEFGRAFPSSSAVGDSAVAGSLEVAWRPTLVPKVAAGSEAYAFVDGGRAWTRDRPFQPAFAQGLSSAGGGVRLAAFAKGVIEIEASRSLTAPRPGMDQPWRATIGFRSLLN